MCGIVGNILFYCNDTDTRKDFLRRENIETEASDLLALRGSVNTTIGGMFTGGLSREKRRGPV